MAGIGPADLYDQSAQLLQASIDCLNTIPSSVPGLLGAPERAFVVLGQPTLDCCDQLTVDAQPTLEAATQPLELGAGTRHQQQFRKNYVGFRVTVTRCIPWGDEEIPTAEQQDAAAQQSYADGWALWNLLWNMARAGEIFTICGGVYFDRLTPLSPSGGCGGMILNIRGEMQGYEGTP